MNEISIQIPDAFLQPLDELVQQSGAPSREEWVKGLVRNFLFEYQMRKEFGPKQQQRGMQLMTMWP